MKKIFITHEKFFDFLYCNISQNNDTMQDGHVVVSLLSFIALQTGLTLVDMLPHTACFLLGTSHLRWDFHTMLKSKKHFLHSL